MGELTGEVLARHLRLDALLYGTVPPEGANVEYIGDELVVSFRRVVSSDHGDEGLTIRYHISQLTTGAVYRGLMAHFVNPEDFEYDAVPAREPDEPSLEILERTALDPMVCPADPYDRPSELLQVLIEQKPAYNQLEKCIEDDLTFEERDQLQVPKQHLHWSRYDEHYVAWVANGDILIIAAIRYDDYAPATASELYEMVEPELTEYFARAGKVAYKFDPPNGWMRMCYEDREAEAWTCVDD